MHSLCEQPFDENDEESFRSRTNPQIHELLQIKSNKVETKDILSYEKSLEFLSMSIQNRIKVEAEEQKKIEPKNAVNLSKFENLVKNLTQKIEE